MKANRLLTNSLSIAVNRVAQSVGSFLLVATIARVLGPYELGQYTLGFSFYFLFMSISSEGLKILFTRNLSQSPEDVSKYLISGSFLQFIVSLFAYSVLFVLVSVLPYRPDTASVCYLLGLMVIPFSLSNVTEAIFQAQEKMYLIAASTVPIYVARLLLAIVAMQRGYGVNAICLLMVASEALVLLVQWGLISRYVRPDWPIRWDFIKQTALDVRTFLAIQGMSVFNSRASTLILSVVGGEVVVGLLSAVLQLMQPFIIVKDSLGLALFPSMAKAARTEDGQQRTVAEQSMELLLCTAIPSAIGLQLFGDRLLLLVYGSAEFGETGNILAIYGWLLLGTAIATPMTYALVANGMERVNLIEQTVTTFLTLLLGLFLIDRFLLVGAAATSVVLTTTATCFYLYFVRKQLFSIRFWRILRRPLLIGGVMFCLMKVLQQTVQSFWVVLAISVACYGLVALGVVRFTAGDSRFAFSKRN